MVKPSPKDYHYLESNRALPHPLDTTSNSETQARFRLPVENTEEYIQNQKRSMGDRTARISDNKKTHFIYGFDCPQYKTEKV